MAQEGLRLKEALNCPIFGEDQWNEIKGFLSSPRLTCCVLAVLFCFCYCFFLQL